MPNCNVCRRSYIDKIIDNINWKIIYRVKITAIIISPSCSTHTIHILKSYTLISQVGTILNQI